METGAPRTAEVRIFGFDETHGELRGDLNPATPAGEGVYFEGSRTIAGLPGGEGRAYTVQIE